MTIIIEDEFTLKKKRTLPLPGLMIGSTIGNFHVISAIDKIADEIIYKVQCVCGRFGNISETGIKSRVSCGCSFIIGKHRIGLVIHGYKFIKFIGDKNGKHEYEIHCSRCNQNSIVSGKYHRKLCPKCPRLSKFGDSYIDLQKEASRIGIHRNALRQRLLRMPINAAISMGRHGNIGGKKGIHGDVWFNNELNSIPNHLRKIGKLNKKSFVYFWIRKGVDPSIAISMALNCRVNTDQAESICSGNNACIAV